MPILRLHAENIGPFEELHLDLTDGNGKAHLGPHILAGVNGSGKTTVLRTIAWCLNGGDSGFDQLSWLDFLHGQRGPRALVELEETQKPGALMEHPFRSLRHSKDPTSDLADAVAWAQGVTRRAFTSKPLLGPGDAVGQPPPQSATEKLGCVAAYSPVPVLKRLDSPPNRLTQPTSASRLAFDASVSNEQVQAYWIDAFSREALAKSKAQEEHSPGKNSVEALKRSVAMLLGPHCVPDVNIEKSPIQPILRFRDIELNLSQLPAGFNATLGWVGDYLFRLDSFNWPDDHSAHKRPGLLLFDEIESHLHPRWQRLILNSIRAAFPNTQIIVTTHSPFVISSCPEARLHLLDLDERGKARVVESTDAPAGASLSANVRGVFGIGSEFGPEIEDLLKEWNNLKKHAAVGSLPPRDQARLEELKDTLSEKGEEVASIVADPPVLPPDVIQQLAEAAAAKHR